MIYINTICTGLLCFPFVAIVFTLPFVMYEYHKYSAVSKYKTLVNYSFILYMLISYFMVILPLPDPASTVGNLWQDHLNLIPFKQIWLYWNGRVLDWTNVMAYLRSFSLWQLLFNILLTLPFGIYLHYYFKQSFKRTLLFSFLLSLFFETTQISALYGIYPGPYRLADVEDLICNTLGGVCGYQVAYVFIHILPDRDVIDAHCREVGVRITGRRRFWATLFDALSSLVWYIFLRGLVNLFLPTAIRMHKYDWAGFWTFFCVYSLIQVLITDGSTLGHAICHVILVREDGGYASRGQLFRRYLYVWLFAVLPLFVAEWLTGPPFTRWVQNDFVLIFIVLASRVYMIEYFVNEMCRKGARRMAHDRLSGTNYMAIKLADPRKKECENHGVRNH